MTIASYGLAKTHQFSQLGQYREDGTWNNRKAYKNAAGYHISLGPGGGWMVRTNYIISTAYNEIQNIAEGLFHITLIQILFKLQVHLHFQQIFYFKVSDTKGSKSGNLDSGCSAYCPSDCSNWNVAFIEGIDGNTTWKLDSTLTVTCQGD